MLFHKLTDHSHRSWVIFQRLSKVNCSVRTCNVTDQVKSRIIWSKIKSHGKQELS